MFVDEIMKFFLKCRGNAYFIIFQNLLKKKLQKSAKICEEEICRTSALVWRINY